MEEINCDFFGKPSANERFYFPRFLNMGKYVHALAHGWTKQPFKHLVSLLWHENKIMIRQRSSRGWIINFQRVKTVQFEVLIVKC